MSRRLLLLVALLFLAARTLHAQIGGAGCETFITITQSPASPLYSTSATITVEYGDLIPDPGNQCLSYGGPNPSSFRFTRAGVDVTSSFSVGANQAVGTISLVDEYDNDLVATIDGNDVDGNPRQDSDIRYVFVDTTPAPDVNPTPYNPDVQDFGRCAMACFGATYAHSTVPYFTLDTPRNVTLVYNGDRLTPKPFVHVDVTHPAAAPTVPSEFRLSVQLYSGGLWTNQTFLNGETTLRFTAGTQTVRLGGQLDAGALATGAYPFRILVTSVYAGGSVATVQLDTRLVVVNEAGSAVARGWTIAGVQRLYAGQDANGSVLITEGDGSAVYFNRPCPTCSFTTPGGDFSRLVTGTPGGGSGWTRKYADSTMVVFNTSGQMTEIRDRFLNKTTFAYDGGRLIQIVDPTNFLGSGTTILSYGVMGLASIQDPAGRITTASVAGSNRMLTGITDPDAIGTTFGYDGSLRLQTIIGRASDTTTLAYDAQTGKLATITAPAIPTLNEGTVSPVTTLTAWQRAGVPYGLTGAPTGTPMTPVAPATAEAVITDPGSHQTRFTVNRYGQPLRTTDALGVASTATYDYAGHLTYLTTPLSATAYTYDVNGFLTSVSANGNTRSMRYGAWGQVDSTWATAGAAQRLFIGANGRVDSVRVGGRAGVPANQQTTYRYTYESHGRIETVRDPQQHLAARTWYNLSGNYSRSKDSLPGGRVTTYGYDAYGRGTTVAQTGQPTRTTDYDILNRPLHQYDGVNASPTTLAYNLLGLASVTDPKGQVYAFDYNRLGMVTRRYDPLGYYESYHYSRDGDLLRWSNRRGQSVDYAYDAVHRLWTKSGVNTTSDTLIYTPDGRVVTARNSTSVVTTYLGATGLVDSVSTVLAGHTYWRRYRYTAGRLDSVWTAGSYTGFLNRRFAYNTAFGSLDSMRLGFYWTRFSFNPDRQVTSLRFVGGDSVSAEMTSLHGPRRVFSAQVDQRYHLDGVGRMDVASGWLGKQRNFTFDNLGRLAQTAHRPAGSCSGATEDNGYTCTSPAPDSTHTYTYDQVGNRTDLGGTYNTGNRMSQFNGCTYWNDTDGNITSRSCGGQTVTFTWSAENRLTSYSVSGGATVTMDYDAGGRLSRRASNAGTTYMLWDGANLVSELDAGGLKVAEYSYYGMDRLHSMVIGTTYYQAHQDAQGNVLALTDQNRVLARTYNYEDFGRAAGGTDYAGLAGRDRARWKGALWMGPEVELYYMRNRWYEPQTGRFLSEDPTGLSGGINQYAFGAADPVNAFDPSGLDQCKNFREYVESGEKCDPPPDQQLPPINVTAPACDLVCILGHEPTVNWPDGSPSEPEPGLGGWELGPQNPRRIIRIPASMDSPFYSCDIPSLTVTVFQEIPEGPRPGPAWGAEPFLVATLDVTRVGVPRLDPRGGGGVTLTASYSGSAMFVTLTPPFTSFASVRGVANCDTGAARFHTTVYP